MSNPRSSKKFIHNLHKFICSEEEKYDKSVKWIQKDDKKGFCILNLRDFHERCILNLITLSYDHKSLFRQFHNYKFRQSNGFWYHLDNKFFRDSDLLILSNLKRTPKSKQKQEKENLQKDNKQSKVKRCKRKQIIPDSSINKKRKKNASTQTEDVILEKSSANNSIIEATEDFICNEAFNRINFDNEFGFIEEDFSSCFSFLDGVS